MAEQPLQLQFQYDAESSAAAVSMYCKKFLPFLSRSVGLYFALPTLAYVLFIVLFANGSMTFAVDVLFRLLPDGFTSSRSLRALIMFLPFLLATVLFVRIVGPLRAKYLSRSYAALLPGYSIDVEVDDDWFQVSGEFGSLRYRLEKLTGLLSYKDGLVIGAGMSAIYLPKETFSKPGSKEQMLRLFKKSMTPQAMADSFPEFQGLN